MNIYVPNIFIIATDYAITAKKETTSQMNANSTLKQDQEVQVKKS
mgnify:CR=1 FL=1